MEAAERTQNYHKHIELYRKYHESFVSGRTSGYSGRSILKQLKEIREFSRRIKAADALDYGCGRGEQYEWNDIRIKEEFVGRLSDYFGLSSITLYDPAVLAHTKRPDGIYDLVICTDVLEHVPESDVLWVLRDIMSFGRKGVFVSIACYKAGTILSNGENAHATVRSTRWWKTQITKAKSGRQDLIVNAVFKQKIKLSRRFKIKWSNRLSI